MNRRPEKSTNRALGALLACALTCSFVPAQQQPDYTFRVQSDLVLVNVTVRDKSGNFVRGLKPADFTILEDNKPQKIDSFDVEDVDAVANQNVAQAKPLSTSATEAATTAAVASP